MPLEKEQHSTSSDVRPDDFRAPDFGRPFWLISPMEKLRLPSEISSHLHNVLIHAVPFGSMTALEWAMKSSSPRRAAGVA